jgi:hypothetical protein
MALRILTAEIISMARVILPVFLTPTILLLMSRELAMFFFYKKYEVAICYRGAQTKKY